MTTPAWPYATVLITGGTGTFGIAFTRHLLTTTAAKIRILSRCEHKQARLHAHLLGFNDRMSYLLGDVRDLERLRLACRGVDLVIHAAALKHVPAGEYNPLEVILTNITGSANVVRACLDCEVPQAVLLSSDKAVQPLNCYGATKLTAEKLFIRANHYAAMQGDTRFAVTRYGNVAGSQGSVIELFRRHLARNAPLPITDLSMSRFWMTMAEAIDLVAFTACQRVRGGIVIPSLPAFTLEDLVRAMLDVDDAIPLRRFKHHLRFVGVRPGEKLHEILMTPDEQARAWWDVQGRYLIPPLVQHWHTDDSPGMHWHQAPPSMAHEPYVSGTWPKRLDVDGLRDALALLEDPA